VGSTLFYPDAKLGCVIPDQPDALGEPLARSAVAVVLVPHLNPKLFGDEDNCRRLEWYRPAGQDSRAALIVSIAIWLPEPYHGGSILFPHPCQAGPWTPRGRGKELSYSPLYRDRFLSNRDLLS
jgi:hypothetical protein